MARLLLSKASLHKQTGQLKRYRQYLPSLDLKRQQLIAERAKALKQHKETEQLIAASREIVGDTLPMLADKTIQLEGLVSLKSVEIVEVNVVGVRLPSVKIIEIDCKDYSYFAKPHWVDVLVEQLKTMLELKIQAEINQQRVDILNKAVKKVTQRVNLFDKVLIPEAQKNIKKIRIFLSDAERAGVVRAKLTKQKRLEAES